MKYIKLLLLILIFNISIYAQSITENSLPLRAKNFLNLNFPGNNIETVALYQNGGGYEASVREEEWLNGRKYLEEVRRISA